MAGLSTDRWVRSFSVDDSRLHRKGYTLYKITSYLFPRSSPEALTVLAVWKRYREIQKLHREMKKMHQELYLKGIFPTFAKWNHFRRFDSEVIEERKKSTLSLLEFVAVHSPLFTSSAFVKFFQSSHPDISTDEVDNQNSNIEAIRNSLLLPTEIISPLEYQSSEEDSFSTIDTSTSDLPSNNNKFSKSSSIPPFNQVADIQNESTVSEQVHKPNLPDLLSFNSNMESSQISMSSSETVYFTNYSQNKSYDTTNKEIWTSDNLDEKNTSEGIICDANNELNMSRSMRSNDPEFQRYLNNIEEDKQSQISNNYRRSSSRLDTLSIDTAFTPFVEMQENYVFEAGYLLSLGARNESKGDYYRAFDCYKAGIEKMLIGVQSDTNDLRRQFVKDKTTKYLSHAERLYATYLNNPHSEPMPEDKSYIEVTPKDIKKRNINDFCKPYKDLEKFRVLGIIDGQVLLVLSSDIQECQAIKVIQKKCNQVSDNEFISKGLIDNVLPILPVNIPYMVNLISYIETPNVLFLVLQYASGGKLFDYINKYTSTVSNTPARDVNLENVFIDLNNLDKSEKCGIKTESSNINSDPEQSGDIDQIDSNNEATEAIELDESEPAYDFDQISVTDIVINSQRLLLNVDDALSGRFINNSKETANDQNGDNITKESPNKTNLIVSPVDKLFDDIQEKLKKFTIIEEEQQYTVKSALPPKTICKWGAELLTAIKHLHQHGVICRTLNKNNLLLGDHGQLLLSYVIGYNFQDNIISLLNIVNSSKCYNLYVAPELQQFSFLNGNVNFNERLCDFWSYGAIMYELMTGLDLAKMHPTGIHSHTILNFPENISKDEKSLLSSLLCFNPVERLGSGPSGIEEIKYHPYFNHIDWSIIESDAFTFAR